LYSLLCFDVFLWFRRFSFVFGHVFVILLLKLILKIAYKFLSSPMYIIVGSTKTGGTRYKLLSQVRRLKHSWICVIHFFINYLKKLITINTLKFIYFIICLNYFT
jgi:hypothetical protein